MLTQLRDQSIAIHYSPDVCPKPLTIHQPGRYDKSSCGMMIMVQLSHKPRANERSPQQPVVENPLLQERSPNEPLLEHPSPGELDADPEPDWDSLTEEWLSDEPELESDWHRTQIDLLLRLIKWYWRNSNNVYCSGNTTVYYDESQRTNRNFRGPDLYVVMAADPRPRNSWMVWREGGQYPNVVIELLSNSTAKVDRTTKKDLYRKIWRLPNYFWFHPHTKEFKGFRLVGRSYREIKPNAAGWLWSDELELFLGLHEGLLRLFTADGSLVLLEEEEERLAREEAQERAEQQAQRAEQEAQRAEQEAQRAEQEAQRAEQQAQRAEQERLAKEAAQQRAETEAQRAEQEQIAKEAAQARAERLAERLRELGFEP